MTASPTTTPQRLYIAPLTGIRALAAFWVFTRHFRTELLDAFPGMHLLAPLMNVGYLGVDLFFILSGFILTVTHLDSMNERYDWRESLGFLWLRIGRVWPLTAFVLMLFGSYFLFQAWSTGNPAFLAQLDVPRLVQHLTLVHAWYPHVLDWNGLDWSISAEWMAYLTFGLGGVLLLGRFAKVISPRGMLIVMALLTLPMIVVGSGMQDDTILLFSNDAWEIMGGIVALRVLTEFWIGAILAVYLRDRMLRGTSSRLPVPTITAVAIAVVVYLVTAFDPLRFPRPGQEQFYNGVDQIAPTETIIVLPLFVLLIGSLAVCGRDPLARLLATRPLVLGGKVSYALYLSHPLVIGAGLELTNRSGASGAWLAIIAILVIAASWVFAWVLWRFIEEPARKAARRMLPGHIKV
ncbi:peptidoglycan/LPS O-acetylase OafA/YrhL [Homoserinimonas aerilata]|uniref:Peptidoglycan/LPS O-acetylase OafA/YrhL n=1 Tax=Homoserinimonas aerilata TaxID=1162970 RepID=A0A542YA76_9MICO|nr:acyltransferase [Homoserinimonas aerilata]TQL45001.1 peptidoglycan/LPS O-acetylase OafA/YrhL [Homoserinimonas aerilata]